MKHSDSTDIMTSKSTVPSTERSLVTPGTVTNLDNSSAQGTSKVLTTTKAAISIPADLNSFKQSSTGKDYSSVWTIFATGIATFKETPSESAFKLDKATFSGSGSHTTQQDSVTLGPTEISTLPTSTTSNKDQKSTEGQPMEITHKTILTDSMLTSISNNRTTTIPDETSTSSTMISRELLGLDTNSSNVITDQLSTASSTGGASISHDQTSVSFITEITSTLPPPVCK